MVAVSQSQKNWKRIAVLSDYRTWVQREDKMDVSNAHDIKV